MNKVLFFAALKDVVGKESLQVEASGKTVSEIKALLQNDFPALPLDVAMTAINEEFALDDDIIAKEDVIAFIPPVSGG
ncbi:molybdopterin converting factor subunit 1 [Niallia sp. 03133]|uniref:molybdopterin converting factor subunit 1 n=1 Tax=Niallia sp. 03133 TaxID=3458060 RepID=UPI004043D762